MPDVPTDAFVVHDVRTEDDRRTRTEVQSKWVVVHFGDESISPAPLTTTSRWLHANLRNELAAKQVELRAFSVNVTVSDAKVDELQFHTAARVTPSILGVPVAYAAILSIESLRSRKLIEAMVDVGVEGQRFTGLAQRSVRGRVTESDVADTVQDALASLVRQYKATP